MTKLCEKIDILGHGVTGDEIPQVVPINDRLSLMVECGLGYLKLGQPVTTLSGGEAQIDV